MKYATLWRTSPAPAVVLLAVWCLAATAQVPGSGPGLRQPRVARLGTLGPGIDPTPIFGFGLVQKDPVAKELGLTASDRKKLADLVDHLRSGMARNSQESRERVSALGPAADRNKVREERTRMVRENAALRAETEESVSRILGPRKSKRLHEIHLQAEGPMAFSRPEVLEALEVSPDQTQAIGRLVAEGRSAMESRSAVVDAGPTPGKDGKPGQAKESDERRTAKEETLKAREETTKAIVGLLDRGQRAKYRKMLGEPFDLGSVR